MRVVANILTAGSIMHVDIAKTVCSSNSTSISADSTFSNLTISSMLFKQKDFLKSSGIMDMDFTLLVSNPELVGLLRPGHAGSLVAALPLLDLREVIRL